MGMHDAVVVSLNNVSGETLTIRPCLRSVVYYNHYYLLQPSSHHGLIMLSTTEALQWSCSGEHVGCVYVATCNTNLPILSVSCTLDEEPYHQHCKWTSIHAFCCLL